MDYEIQVSMPELKGYRITQMLLQHARIKGLNERLIIAYFLIGGTPNPPDKLGSKTLHKANQLW